MSSSEPIGDVAVNITETARRYQRQRGIEFPLIEPPAESGALGTRHSILRSLWPPEDIWLARKR